MAAVLFYLDPVLDLEILPLILLKVTVWQHGGVAGVCSSETGVAKGWPL